MNDTDHIKQILKTKGLSYTPHRAAVIITLLNAKSALSSSDIEKNVHNVDRITLYRTLQSFLKTGIIHSVSSNDGIIRYIIDKTESHTAHNTNHVHLHLSCTQCHQVLCVIDNAFPHFTQPNNFRIQSFEIVGKGLCNTCLQSSSSR